MSMARDRETSVWEHMGSARINYGSAKTFKTKRIQTDSNYGDICLLALSEIDIKSQIF